MFTPYLKIYGRTEDEVRSYEEKYFDYEIDPDYMKFESDGILLSIYNSISIGTIMEIINWMSTDGIKVELVLR